MPRKGLKAVTISEEVFKKAEKFIEEYNRKVGWRKIRSMAHLIELATIEYIKKNSKPEE
jgi:hypothetical protein